MVKNQKGLLLLLAAGGIAAYLIFNKQSSATNTGVSESQGSSKDPAGGAYSTGNGGFFEQGYSNDPASPEYNARQQQPQNNFIDTTYTPPQAVYPNSSVSRSDTFSFIDAANSAADQFNRSVGGNVILSAQNPSGGQLFTINPEVTKAGLSASEGQRIIESVISKNTPYGMTPSSGGAVVYDIPKSLGGTVADRPSSGSTANSSGSTAGFSSSTNPVQLMSRSDPVLTAGSLGAVASSATGRTESVSSAYRSSSSSPSSSSSSSSSSSLSPSSVSSVSRSSVSSPISNISANLSSTQKSIISRGAISL